MFGKRVTNQMILDAVRSENKELSGRIEVLENLILQESRKAWMTGLGTKLIRSRHPWHFAQADSVEPIIEAVYSESLVAGNASVTLIGESGARHTEHMSYDDFMRMTMSGDES